MYSSRLKVMTFEKSSPSSLCMRTSSRYIPRVELPVARPRTREGFCRIALATIFAASRLSSSYVCLSTTNISGPSPEEDDPQRPRSIQLLLAGLRSEEHTSELQSQ